MPVNHEPAVAAERTLGEALLSEGDRIGARRALLSALERATGDLELALVERALGATALATGDLDDARARFSHAHAVLARSSGCGVRTEEERALLDHACGLRASEEASVLLRRVADPDGEDPVERALVHAALAVALRRSPHLVQAEDLNRASLGADHPDLAPVLLALGRMADGRGDLVEGASFARRALSVLEGRVIDRHPDLVAARDRVGQSTAASAPVSSRLPARLSLP